MINSIYQLTAPRLIEVTYGEIDLSEGGVLVRPSYLSICRADQRYYQGARSKEVLAKKLPMALIHECMAEVVYDTEGNFKPGERVICIPNTPTEDDDIIAENYRLSSKFRSSGFDGFLQDYVLMQPDRLVRISEDVNPDVASFTELISVSMHIISRFDKIAHSRRNSIGVWGDGNLGFITAILLSKLYPDVKLYVFGMDYDKLSLFTFADEAMHVDEIPDDLKLDHCFECVGGAGCEPAINQMIDHINPEGTIALCGVSENNVAINTRMVLELGLRVFGSSRSGRADFEKTVKFLEDNPTEAHYLETLVGEAFDVRTIPDIHKAFDADKALRLGKTVIHWNK